MFGIIELLILFVLLAAVVGGVVLVIVLARRNVRIPPGAAVGVPICGACGCDVTGHTELHCPQCSVDLREVGIITPQARRGIGPWLGILIWSMLLPIPALIASGLIIGFVVPRVAEHTKFLSYSRLPQARSGETIVLDSVDVRHTAQTILWPWETPVPIAPAQKLSVILHPHTGMPASIRMEIDVPNKGYSYTATDSTRIERRGMPDGDAILEWMTRSGIDAASDEARAEADDIALLIRAADATDHSTTHVTQFDTSGSFSGTQVEPVLSVTLCVLGFWPLLWLVVSVLIYRRLRLPTQPAA